MLAATPDGYIRGVTPMYDPEDNAVVIELMLKIVGFYQFWVKIVMDRICKVCLLGSSSAQSNYARFSTHRSNIFGDI